jgi:acetyl-CoA acetyltransferase
MKPGSVAIVGAAETERLGTLPDHSALRLNVESAVRAMTDAGLDAGDIDGIAGTGLYPVDVAHDLGITPQWVDTTSVGGCSYLLHVRHAAAAIASGMAEVVLITHGESGRSRNSETAKPVDPFSQRGQYEMPYGANAYHSMFTVPVLRYMKETGLTHEQLASVPVAQRRWAHRNPRALMRELITVDDVFASPVIAYPFHRLECCLVTDGGGALIVTSAERAKDLRRPPVYILGTGESVEHPIVSQMGDFTRSRNFRIASQRAFRQAGVAQADVDHVMVYDAFAHLPIYGLEDAGFVGRGEAGDFIAEGNTSPGGRLPMNTNGGGLSYTHTGMYGMFAMQEAVRQLRREAAAQVAGVEISFVLGVGGMFMAGAALILAASPS